MARAIRPFGNISEETFTHESGEAGNCLPQRETFMQRVFVLAKNGNPLMPCLPVRARELLAKGKAKVYRMFPFTIILTEREGGDLQEIEVKVDPGSKTTGIAVVAKFARGYV